MISEISASLRVIHTINEHLSEPQCTHDIKKIMKEAMNFEGQQGLEGENFQSNNRTQSALEQELLIDYEHNRHS